MKYCSAVIRLNKACANMPFRDVTALAGELYKAGCRTETALWIAMKFVARVCETPNTTLMAYGLDVTKECLVSWERDDLNKIGWNIAPLARKCNVMGEWS